eukprot:TRINITY_DN12011_c0_g1_i1.p1 TRINITY_DN12011_c0_g1~~TRINITY_DN12011_c0_g1_i1.p1  ORF type:complete len:410 (+),score=71.38 TRINITY_DN12011_c0_g1_i1:114-1343(+)
MEEFWGHIKSFNITKGWGFIESPQAANIYGKDIFLLKSELPNGIANQGDEVAFNVVQGDKGPQASHVRITSYSNQMPSLSTPGANRGVYGQRRPSSAYGAPTPTVRTPALMANTRSYAPTSMSGKGGGTGEYVGTVKSFNPSKGWGFISGDAVINAFGKDVFVMKSGIANGMELQPNQQVSFTVVQGDKGIQASNVQALSSPGRGTYTYARSHAAPLVPAPPPLQLPASDQFFFGAVKGYNEEKGWGHIICDAAFKAFGKEVFLLKSALNGSVAEAGMLVGFQVKMSPKGPQAQNLAVLPAGSFDFDGQVGQRYIGTVKSYNPEKGWGFITSDEITRLFFGKDVFLRRVALADSSYVPSAGDSAEFSIEVGDSGRLQAKQVNIDSSFGQLAEGYGASRWNSPASRASPF